MMRRKLLPLAALMLCAGGEPPYQSSPERGTVNTPAAEYVVAERKPELLREVNARLRALAAARGYPYADYASVLVDRDGRLRADLTHDGVHPLSAGYALMAPIAEAAIAGALENRN